MRFSARSFSLPTSRAQRSASSAVVAPRRAVPFIGRVSRRSAVQSKNSSGLALATT
jgi:hypothetical protein